MGYSIYSLVQLGFDIYWFMLIGYIFMSWVPAAQSSAIGRFLHNVCEPYLGFFRKFIPPLGMIDISPIVGLFVLRFIEQGVYTVLQMIL